MQWDLCSSAPCVPFYLYTPFHNPMPKPSCQKSRKTKITEKVLLIIQSSNIVHYDQHTQKPACADFQTFSSTFSLYKLTFFIFFLFFVRGSSANSQKFHILLILTGKNTLKWFWVVHIQGLRHAQIQWCRFWSLYNKWFLKNKNFTFCWFWLGKHIEMVWVVHIQGLRHPK